MATTLRSASFSTAIRPAARPGWFSNASQSIIRGLAIEGFGVGISIPDPTDVGDLIQGNSIGEYLVYPVDPLTGIALPLPNNVALAGLGNTQQGILLGSANATVGGIEPQDANVISGNGAQGVLIIAGRIGQPGARQPDRRRSGRRSSGLYFRPATAPTESPIESSGTASNPSGIVYSSSNVIGGAASGSGNVISANHGYGVHIIGVGATRNLVEANYIGAAPGGGYAFGNGQPGNSADGVRIDDAPDNQVGGLAAADGNVISSNKGAGVYVTGADATGNAIENNIIGLTAAGTAVLGNNRAGVADYSPGTLIGPGNVISANLIGVLISGASATGVIVRDNLIGTDSTGTADLGNAQCGIQIDNASGNTIEGDSQGVQVISGNLVGIEIDGADVDPEPDRGQPDRHRQVGHGRSRQLERGDPDRRRLWQHGRRNDRGGPQRDLGQPVGNPARRLRRPQLNLIEGNDVGTDISGTAASGQRDQRHHPEQ